MCEDSIGKADQYDNMRRQKERAEQQRDNADGMLRRCEREGKQKQAKIQQQQGTIFMLRTDLKSERNKNAKRWSPVTWVVIGAVSGLVLRWFVIDVLIDAK